MLKKIKLSNSVLVFLAMILGSIAGLLIGPGAASIGFIGTIWLNMMKMFLVPVVIFVMVNGITSMDDPAMLGRLGIRILFIYTCTTLIATCIAIPVAVFLRPGNGFVFENTNAVMEVSQMPSFTEFCKGLFSTNVFESFTDANMLQVLVISVIIGIAIVFIKSDEQRKSITAWFEMMYNLSMAIIKIVMAVAPIGVFCLMASTMGQYGVEFLATISKLVGTYYVAGIIHFILIVVGLPTLSGYGPIRFIKSVSDTIVTAASTCSSAATIPTNLRVATDKLNIPKPIANFCIPLGAQINQDGAAILTAVVMIFCAQAIGLELTFAQMIQMVLLTTLVSAGAAAVPGGGIVRLMIVGAAFNLPMELIAIVGSLYRLFDMGATAISTVGDASATLFLYRLEERRNKKGKEVTI